jgi:Plant transposon protein.
VWIIPECNIIGGDDAEIYRNRKRYFSINVQTVSDSNLKIRDIVARWPGSVHDQTIFNASTLKRKFERGDFNDKWLLGDSGYAVRSYLLTPLLHTNTPGENLYNESQIRTRNCVERQYGVWKRRFPCLSVGMRLGLEKVKIVIVATAVLHNIAIDRNEADPPNYEGNINNVDFVNDYDNFDNRGLDVTRRALISQYFDRL